MGFLRNLFFGPPKPGKPLPLTDESFQEEVLESDVPAVVDFWSPRCSPCQVMGGLLDETGPDYVGRVNIFKLNVERYPEAAIRYVAQISPSVILFRKGKPAEGVAGSIPLRPLREKLDAPARSET